MKFFRLFLIALLVCSSNAYAQKYVDPKTAASDPAGLAISPSKLQSFKNETRINVSPKSDATLAEELKFGDSRAAVVMATRPNLLVVAYSDELDCIVLLRFSGALADQYKLKEGSRLLTVDTYPYKGRGEDIHQGPNYMKRYSYVHPIIAEFLSDDIDQIEARKAKISEEEWTHAAELGKKYLQDYGSFARRGNPYVSMLPGGLAISPGKLQLFKNDTKISFPPEMDDVLAENMEFGGSGAAVVMATRPDLLVAAYSDRLDCIVLLRFSGALADQYKLKEGSRLLTVSIHPSGGKADDIHPGPGSSGRASFFYPIITEFLSDDISRIEARKSKISSAEWSRAAELGEKYLQDYGPLARQGNPYISMQPAPSK